MKRTYDQTHIVRWATEEVGDVDEAALKIKNKIICSLQTALKMARGTYEGIPAIPKRKPLSELVNKPVDVLFPREKTKRSGGTEKNRTA